MTRWARSKSSHKHERQPQEATAWKDFVAQRQAQHRENDAEDVLSPAGPRWPDNLEPKAREAGIHRVSFPKKPPGADVTTKDTAAPAKTSGGKLELSNKKTGLEKMPKENSSLQTNSADSEVPAASKKKVGRTLPKKRKAPLQKEEVSSGTTDNSQQVTAGAEVPLLDKKANSPAAKKRKKTPSDKKRQGPPAGTKQSESNSRGSKVLPVQYRGKGTAKLPSPHQEQLEDLSTVAAPGRSQPKKGRGASTKTSGVDQGQLEDADSVPQGAKAERLQRLRREREAKGLLLLPEKVERKIYMLKKAMRKKGLPGEEIKEAVRKMRRKEELLFRRQLAKLCFKCRQPGHRVQDCPVMLGDSDQAVGICFKCGSTEHFSSACAVRTSASNEFPFAKCFICQQQGHLSRKCPQNEKGAYPRGGHCNFCGAVDHFKRECPEMERNKKKAEEGEEAFASVADLAQSADAENLQPFPVLPKTKKSKVVTF
ncbi:uncharacterized protein LOC8037546 [Ixodes scapularis]|uniref:uncharacterized protein LOC8037546 n=1 Tax=Ixodes scapularis TaxID=6945 RepID=UPI001C3861F0|nr:uncharacterized protein LOC8037546 [Ixodes scapularis]